MEDSKQIQRRRKVYEAVKDHRRRVLEAGGTFLSPMAVKDPEIAYKLQLRAKERHNGSKCEVVREALEFFLNHSGESEGSLDGKTSFG